MATNNNASNPYMSGMNQSNQRGHAVWFDQHRNTSFKDEYGDTIFENGRPYYSVIELKTRMPVGPVRPLGWTAPAYAPDQYIVKSIGRVTNLPKRQGAEGLQQQVTTDRFRIDYAVMIRDDEEATLAHWRLAVATADARGWEPPHLGQAMDRRLLEIIGDAPRNPKIAQAMLAGNPWILGQLMPTVDRATGKTMVEPDEQLVRLLSLNRAGAYTYEMAEREAERERAESTSPGESAAMRDLLAEALEQNRKLAALLAERERDTAATGKRGPGRPPKVKADEPATVG